MASRKNIATLFRMVDTTLLGIFNFVRFMARFVPPSVLVAIAVYLGYALYYTRRGAREYLLETMRECLPEVDDEQELKRLAKQAFGAAFRAMLDLILLERHGDEIMDKLILDERSLAGFDEGKAAGKGLVMFSPHLGNLTIPLLAARLGRSYTPLVMAPADTPIPRYLNAVFDLAISLGLDRENPVFFRGPDTITKVREHLRQGKIMGITYDMMGGTVVDLFGRPTAIASGIAHFACDTGAPILPGFLKRTKDPLRYELVYCGDLNYNLTGDRDADVQTILNEVIRKGEEMIRQVPGQWIGWFGLRGWRKRAEKILREENKS